MLHEDRSALSTETLDMKRAIDSLREELEAVDWYKQRAEACNDEDLRNILLHNMREEQEHAAMILSWMRSKDKNFQDKLDLFLLRKPANITQE